MTDTTSRTSVPGLVTPRPSGAGDPPSHEPAPPTRHGPAAAPRVPTALLTALVAAVAVITAVRSPASPVGGTTTDAVLVALFVATLTVAGSRARSGALAVFAGIAVVAATGPGLVAAIAALVLAGTALLAPMLRVGARRAPTGAVIAALASCSCLWGTELRMGWAVACGVLGSLVVLASALRAAPRDARGAIVAVAVLAVVLVVVACGAWGVAAFGAKADATEGVDHLKAGLDAAQDGDVDQAATELRAASDAMHAAHDALTAPWAIPAQHLPVVGPNARAVDDLTSLAARLADIAERTARAADLNAIASEGGTIDLVKLHDVEASISELDTAVTEARVRLARLDSPWLVAPLVDRLAEAREKLDDAAPSIANARDATRALPILLGEGKGSRYLVLFGTPVEARGRAGFPGNWAEVIAIDGQVRMTRFGRLIELNDVGVEREDRVLTGLDEYQTRYGQFLPSQYWQNVPMSPDLPTVAQAAAQLYPQSGGGKIDGVVMMDVQGIVSLLELTGPVDVDLVDEPLGVDNAADFLLRRQYLELPNDDRVDLLAQVARATITKLTSMELPGMRTTADVLGDAVAKGHLRFVSFDDRVAPLLERTRIDGAMGPVEGDDVMLLTNNAGGNKIDLFLRRTLDYAVTWNPTTGAVDGTLTVTLHNDAPAKGLPDSLIGNAIDDPGPFEKPPSAGTNRMWLSVYSAFVPKEVTLDGAPALAQFDTEVGRRVTSLLVDVPPGGSRTLTLHWTGAVAPGAAYSLGLPAQPLARPDEARVKVTIAGSGTAAPRTVEGTATLDRDRRIEVPVP